jgi:hypothetical protein
MAHHGSCHCGRIGFTAEGEIGEVLSCNCSYCERRGSLLWFVPADKFVLSDPDTDIGSYTFNTHKIEHRFCPVCGIVPFSEAVGPHGPTIAVNARCLEDVDIEALTVKHYDGRSK